MGSRASKLFGISQKHGQLPPKAALEYWWLKIHSFRMFLAEDQSAACPQGTIQAVREDLDQAEQGHLLLSAASSFPRPSITGI